MAIEQWITVHPNGKEEKGQPIPVEKGQSKGDAVKAFIDKHKKDNLEKKYNDDLPIDSAKGEIISVKPIKNDYVRKVMQGNKVEFIPIRKLSRKLSEQEIINRVGGLDKTKGSCASAAFAYLGNKGGVDVLDFRGGVSMRTISTVATIKQIAQMEDVLSSIVETYSDFDSARKVLSTVKEGKEYYFGCGEHAAIVRRQNGKLQYLELQGANGDNGFKELNYNVLKKRFKAKKSHQLGYTKLKFPSILIDGESLQKSNDFINFLPYINTNLDKQKK